MQSCARQVLREPPDRTAPRSRSTARPTRARARRRRRRRPRDTARAAAVALATPSPRRPAVGGAGASAGPAVGAVEPRAAAEPLKMAEAREHARACAVQHRGFADAERNCSAPWRCAAPALLPDAHRDRRHAAQLGMLYWEAERTARPRPVTAGAQVSSAAPEGHPATFLKIEAGRVLLRQAPARRRRALFARCSRCGGATTGNTARGVAATSRAGPTCCR